MTTAAYKLKDGKSFYRVFEVNRLGRELKDKDDDKLVSDLLLREVRDDITDVVIASHGWNTSQLTDDSVGFYNSLFNKLIEVDEDYDSLLSNRPDTKFQFIGVHWPSAPLQFLTGSKEPEPTVESIKQMQQALETTDPVAASKLKQMLDDLESTPEGEYKVPHHLDDLPENVRKDFVELIEAMEPEDEAKIGLGNEDINNAVKPEAALEHASAGDTEDKKPSAVFDGIVRTLFGGIENVVFGRFEERAKTIGAVGVHQLLAKLQKAANPKTRFHLVGHSLGCHVVNSALLGSPSTGNQLLRKIHSLLLLQGAVPYNCYSRGGEYRAVCSQFQPVAGPILVTHSKHDNALHAYRQFHGDALGHKGAHGAHPVIASFMNLMSRTHKYRFGQRCLYNLNADKYIDEKTSVLGIDVDGAHSDVFDPETLHCLYEALRLNLPDSAYDLPKVPSDYFENLRKQREEDDSGCIIS